MLPTEILNKANALAIVPCKVGCLPQAIHCARVAVRGFFRVIPWLLLLVYAEVVGAGVVVESMHRSVSGFAIATANSFTQSNFWILTSTNGGATNFDIATSAIQQPGSGEAARGTVAARQASTIAFATSNFHFNASGGYSVAADVDPTQAFMPSAAARGTNRGVITFRTDQESVVRVRSTVIDSTFGTSAITVSSNGVVVLRAGVSGVEQNGGLVATNGETYRFSLAPGRYVLELDCTGQVATTGADGSQAQASYQFEFTAVYSRIVPGFPHSVKVKTVRIYQSYPPYKLGFSWPLEAIRFDLMESTNAPQACFSCWATNALLWSLSTNVLESDGTSFLLDESVFAIRNPEGKRMKMYKLERK